MRTAAISGGLGDTIYALPVLHKLGVKRLYVKQVALEDGSDTYTALKDLIEMQGIECLPTSGAYPLHEFEPRLEFDYNLDSARNQPRRGSNHIIRSFMAQFNVFMQGWREPWLKVETNYPYTGFDFTVVALTPRWRDESKVDWRRVWKVIPKPAIFVGFETDYDDFCERYTDWETESNPLNFHHTKTLLEAAQIVKAARRVYCNQSSILTLAQGLGKEYWVEQKPRRTNTLLGTRNEHILT